MEIFSTPYVKAEKEGENTYYGHGLWIHLEPGGQPEVYMTGGDAGVSFRSSVKRASDLQVTVIANTTHGAWPVLRDIETALKALR